MRKKIPLAAYLFFLIFKGDKKIAKKILCQLDYAELRNLTATLRILNPHARDLKEKFQKEFSDFFTKSKRIRSALIEKTSPAGKGFKLSVSQNNSESNIYLWFILLCGIFGILALLIFKNHFSYSVDFINKSESLWLSYFAYLALFPFFLSYALKYRYFSKIGNIFLSLYLLIASTLFLIGLLAILNYITGNLTSGKATLDKSFLGLILFGIILGPWIEEVLFRGFILDQFIMFFSKKGEESLKKNSNLMESRIPLENLILAISASSICFAFIHEWVNPAGLFIYFLCGMILGYARIRSGNLWISFISHSMANGTLLFFA
jgi:membrane protease YdiL (CAAX protease family)